jgi:hypothetical protein
LRIGSGMGSIGGQQVGGNGKAKASAGGGAQQTAAGKGMRHQCGSFFIITRLSNVG